MKQGGSMQRKVLFAIFLFMGFHIYAGAKKMSFHDFKTVSIQGKEVSLSEYKGHPVLVVNVASKCGYTPQYEGLEKIHQSYKDQGLKVVGFPSNDFGGQEPGTESQIAEFCKLNFGVTFDLMKKTKVLGNDKDPVYQFLTENSKEKGDVKWNFEKFLIDKKGNVMYRFPSGTKPESAELKQAIEALL
ncbi:glutathione peroxidase [Leptospira wolbachii serovar Codice str. CDC]|uniref:Glutathione peroxidase n=1 Tax=Leptospira wolbachii serovar Codice str. CDC TaxID=1218599 RepID=R9A632_9LEPT|nr:glutathione peroxidase [Leptospira wolbachii serovar Codice str. CDC]